MIDFDVVVREHGPKLLRKAVAQCSGNYTFAEDALQETFTAAWKYQDSFDGGNLGGWLHRILGNKIIDARRSKRKTSFLHLSLDGENSRFNGPVKEEFLAYTPPDPDEVNVTDVVAKAIESLPKDYADICRLRFLEEMPLKDIAVKLEIPIGTVLSRMFRVKGQLRKNLKKALAQ